MAAGNIEPRGPGKWRLRVSAGTDPITRERIVIRQPFVGTKTEAEKELARLIAHVDDGSAARGTNRTLNYLIDEWLPAAQLAESTRYNYRRNVDKHVRDTVGKLPLTKINAHVLDRYYHRQTVDGVGADTVRYTHAILSSALSQAVKWEWLVRNPAVNATPPAAPERHIATPTPAQYRDVLKVAHATLLRTAVAIHIGGHLGPRCGEICGLQWPDINLDDGTIRVVRTVGTVPGVGEVVKVIKGNAKRHRAPRPIDAATVELLRLWDVATADARAAGANPDQWVFQAPRKLSFYRPSTMSADFKAVARAAGVGDIHMHSLRHYVATQLLDAGVPVGTVSRRLSHSKTSTTHDMYEEEVPESARAAADTIARINKG